MTVVKSNGKPLEILTITDNFLKYLENIETCSGLTIKAYHLDLSQAFPELSASIKRTRIYQESELFAQARQALLSWGNLSLASRNRKSATLKSFFSYLFREGYVERDLAAQIHSPKVPKKIPHFISVDEVIAVLQSFDRDAGESSGLEKVLFMLLYGAGLRVSEACGLQWKRIDFSRRVILIRGKGDKERMVALPQNLARLLQSEHQKSNTEFVWGEQPLNPRTAYEWIRSRGVKAGLMRPIHPHALRHSFATHLLASGANLRTLQELLGHESLTATEKYTHLGVDQLARTLENHHPFGQRKKA
jgi:integrase/recombinase XerC/integrase/recombinase XerD